MSRRWWVWAAAALVAGCMSEGREGEVRDAVVDTNAAVDAVEDTTQVPDVDAADDTGPGEDAADPADTVADTAADTEADAAQPVCGDGVLEGGEACDDGNDCPFDGCAPDCTLEPTAVLVRLALDPGVGFDLDDADGDGDPYTGIDNKLAQDDLLRAQLNAIIASFIEAGDIIQLVTLGRAPTLADDPDVAVTLYQGIDPACPASASPVPWTDADDPGPHLLWSDARSFEACAPEVTLGDAAISPVNTDPAQPAAPFLGASAESVILPIGPLGSVPIARGRLEAAVASTVVSGAGAFEGLVDGRIGGVIPAEALYGVDLSSVLPGCPTALHAVLAFIGHIDQDAEGNGTLDWIQFTVGGSLPCIVHPVNIVGCCNDGDCDDYVPGDDCVLDPRIGDGYSAGFRFEARAVSVTGQVDGGAWCQGAR